MQDHLKSAIGSLFEALSARGAVPPGRAILLRELRRQLRRRLQVSHLGRNDDLSPLGFRV